MSQDDRLAFVKKRFGEHGDEIIGLFRNAYPDHDILDLAYTDSRVRIPTAETALLHAKNGRDNTYVYNVAYEMDGCRSGMGEMSAIFSAIRIVSMF